jgi:ABC-2 type transport system permease protein
MLETARDVILGDLRLYLRLIVLQVRAQAQYKVSLAIDVGTYFAVTTLEFTVVLILFSRFPSMAGWQVGDVAMLTAVSSFAFGIAELVGAGIDAFDETIRRGEFDRVLLRPVSAIVQVVGSDFRLRRLGRISEGFLIFAFAVHVLPPIQWTPAKLLMLPVGIFSGAAVFIAVLLVGAAICFWTIETTEITNSLTYGGREALSWPLAIYNRTLQGFFLFVVPLAFGTYVPVCYLLGRPLPLGLPAWVAFCAPVAAGAFALAAAAFWRFGVSHYQSTGS